MELLWFSVKVMVIGMVVVFIGLIILIGAIKVLSAVMDRIEGGKRPPRQKRSFPPRSLRSFPPSPPPPRRTIWPWWR